MNGFSLSYLNEVGAVGRLQKQFGMALLTVLLVRVSSVQQALRGTAECVWQQAPECSWSSCSFYCSLQLFKPLTFCK